MDITTRRATSILTKPSGFARDFDYSLNPYSGCAFGCTYCYAAFFARSQDLQDTWGRWVEVKENALELLKRRRKRPLLDKVIYISTVTDPYQPVEAQLKLTRAVLQELLDYHQVRVMMQTRGDLVTRDIDLFEKFRFAQVNMTITTDDDEVRKRFEPTCTSIERRFRAVRMLSDAGVQTVITMTPLLPVRDPQAFAARLLASGAQRFVVQEFHASRARFMAGTGEAAQALARDMGWTAARYRDTRAILAEALPRLEEGRAGFTPRWSAADAERA